MALKITMKAKYFNYVVCSNGRSIKGRVTRTVAIAVERMTQLASWAAQEIACEEGWEFDLLNFSVAVRPIIPVNESKILPCDR
jgi:hypothetical protein